LLRHLEVNASLSINLVEFDKTNLNYIFKRKVLRPKKQQLIVQVPFSGQQKCSSIFSYIQKEPTTEVE